MNKEFNGAIINRFHNYILEQQLIRRELNPLVEEELIIVALSGGVDSVALLLLLHEASNGLPIKIYPIHIHHHIRDNADEDVLLCEKLCRKLNLPLRVVHVDAPKYAVCNKLSEEEAGRNLRYLAFSEYQKELNATGIALGHHKEDQCETILHRFLRGSGLLGLIGMTPRNGVLIRPLLDFTKDELKTFVVNKGEKYIEDYTNIDTSYTRNHIRHALIPYIKENYNPNIVESTHRLSELLSEDEDFLEKETLLAYNEMVTKTKNNEISLDIDGFLRLHAAIQKRVIRECIKQIKGDLKNIEYQHIKRILGLIHLESGKQADIVNGYVVRKEFNHLIFADGKSRQYLEKGFYYTLDIKSYKGYIQNAKLAYTIKVSSLKYYKDSFKNSQNAYTKSFDCDRIKATLVLRTRMPGDIIHIDCEGHKKTLKKFFVDEKIPLSMRDEIPLLAMGNHILWIVGYRVNPMYEETPDSKKTLVVELTKEETNGNS